MTEKEKKEESKDYIINLRVSRATYDKVKQKAKENRETVSNLLRKVIDDSAEIVTDFSGGARRASLRTSKRMRRSRWPGTRNAQSAEGRSVRAKRRPRANPGAAGSITFAKSAARHKGVG